MMNDSKGSKENNASEELKYPHETVFQLLNLCEQLNSVKKFGLQDWLNAIEQIDFFNAQLAYEIGLYYLKLIEVSDNDESSMQSQAIDCLKRAFSHAYFINDPKKIRELQPVFKKLHITKQCELYNFLLKFNRFSAVVLGRMIEAVGEGLIDDNPLSI